MGRAADWADVQGPRRRTDPRLDGPAHPRPPGGRPRPPPGRPLLPRPRGDLDHLRDGARDPVATAAGGSPLRPARRDHRPGHAAAGVAMDPGTRPRRAAHPVVVRARPPRPRHRHRPSRSSPPRRLADRLRCRAARDRGARGGPRRTAPPGARRPGGAPGRAHRRRPRPRRQRARITPVELPRVHRDQPHRAVRPADPPGPGGPGDHAHAPRDARHVGRHDVGHRRSRGLPRRRRSHLPAVRPAGRCAGERRHHPGAGHRPRGRLPGLVDPHDRSRRGHRVHGVGPGAARGQGVAQPQHQHRARAPEHRSRRRLRGAHRAPAHRCGRAPRRAAGGRGQHAHHR
ncbi:hypothetical protein JAAN108728_10150 [Janibacter anophelis]